MLSAVIWPLLIYWFVLFVVNFAIVEFGQDQFYDEVTPYSGLKVLVGSLILALVSVWIRPKFESLFTSDLPWTVLLGIVWWVVFTLIYQFHPGHAAAIALPAMLLISGAATIGIESIMKPGPIQAPASALQNMPARRPQLSTPPDKAAPTTKSTAK